MHRGTAAATLVLVAIGLLALALVQSIAWAYYEGAYLLTPAPLLGLGMAVTVFFALRRVCTTGSRSAEAFVFTCLLLTPIIAYFGVSFGGFQLLVPGVLLAIAAVITPRPA